VIPGADGTRKVRWKRAGTGKSGGVRVIYFHLTDEEVVLLVAVYAKAERENILPQGHPKGGDKHRKSAGPSRPMPASRCRICAMRLKKPRRTLVA